MVRACGNLRSMPSWRSQSVTGRFNSSGATALPPSSFVTVVGVIWVWSLYSLTFPFTCTRSPTASSFAPLSWTKIPSLVASSPSPASWMNTPPSWPSPWKSPVTTPSTITVRPA